LAVLFVNEETACCAGAGVEVFIAAPDCGIHVPGMELERDVSDRVRQVPDYKDGVAMCKFGDGQDVEELAGVVLDSWEEDEGGAGSMLRDDGEDLISGECGVGERR
jgi:hypothetical protein